MVPGPAVDNSRKSISSLVKIKATYANVEEAGAIKRVNPEDAHNHYKPGRTANLARDTAVGIKSDSRVKYGIGNTVAYPYRDVLR